MARVTPANYTLHITQRATFEEEFVLKAASSPVNLQGFTLIAQIWETEKRLNKLADIDVVVLNAAQGRFKLRIPRTTTRTMTKNGYWDLLVIEPGGDADYWLEGVTAVDFGLTDNQ